MTKGHSWNFGLNDDEVAVVAFLRRNLQAEDKNGALHCRQLLGRSIRTPSELEEAAREKLFARVCPKLVRSAATILEAMLEGSRDEQ